MKARKIMKFAAILLGFMALTFGFAYSFSFYMAGWFGLELLSHSQSLIVAIETISDVGIPAFLIMSLHQPTRKYFDL